MAAPKSPFRYFNSSPEVIRLVVMMYVKYPLSLRNVEDLLAEDEDTPEVQLGTRSLPQPLQSGAPPHQQRDLQAEPLRRTGRVAVPRGLEQRRPCPTRAWWRQVAVRLAAPFEATIASARAFLYAASVMLLTRRLARSA